MTDREKQILKTYYDDMIEMCDETIKTCNEAMVNWMKLKTKCIEASKNLKLGCGKKGHYDNKH